MRTAFLRRIGIAAVALAVTAVLAACSSAAPDSTSDTAQSTAAMPTGTVGAAHFDAGYLAVGTGSTKVDTYVDPMCPYCGQFEKANGRALADLVNAGEITLRVHPLNFLDPHSQGTNYSSRASGALTCVAASDPKATLTYLSQLFENQPAENSPGLTDAKLRSLAHDVGTTDADACITSHRYAAWISNLTQKALNGPIPGADITSIRGTPTVLVNGHSYPGDITDTSALTKFIGSGGK
jgi:protein-disulfide isomerase